MKKTTTERMFFYVLLFVAVFMFLSAFYLDFNNTVKNPYVIGIFSLFFFFAAFAHSWMARGRRFTLIFFGVMLLCSFSAEYAGTHAGIFYSQGEKPLLLEGQTYYYSDYLPLHIFRIPIVLLLMWPFIIYSEFYIASLISQRIFSGKRTESKKAKIDGIFRVKMRARILIFTIIVASLLAMLWDIAFDPLATKLGFWTWVGGGSAFKWINGGIPVGNFTSWFLITFISLAIFVVVMTLIQLRRTNRTDSEFVRNDKIGSMQRKDDLLTGFKRDRNGMVIALYLFLFIFMFAVPQREFGLIVFAAVTQVIPWMIFLRNSYFS